MHYSNKSTDCRLDTFKPSGKWYDTLTLDMSNSPYKGLLRDDIKKAIKEQYPHLFRESGWMIVCLEPHHENSHPICIIT